MEVAGPRPAMTFSGSSCAGLTRASSAYKLSRLLRRAPMKFLQCRHFAAQPLRRNVETIGPCRRTMVEIDLLEEQLVTQGFQHAARFGNELRKIMHAARAVVETDPEP